MFRFIFVVFAFPVSAASIDGELAGVASVIDGDTIEVHGQRIRLHGIDAVESRQYCIEADGREWRCGQDAAFALSDKIGRNPVRCDQRDIDRYGRVVGVCFQGRVDLNEWMVFEGWAVAYRQYSLDYVAAEDAARRDKRGMWRAEFQMPWDWRRERRRK